MRSGAVIGCAAMMTASSPDGKAVGEPVNAILTAAQHADRAYCEHAFHLEQTSDHGAPILYEKKRKLRR
jgi:hypothetical protein